LVSRTELLPMQGFPNPSHAASARLGCSEGDTFFGLVSGREPHIKRLFRVTANAEITKLASWHGCCLT
jgi:hypothetical protein